jgi:hypothetical protein
MANFSDLEITVTNTSESVDPLELSPNTVKVRLRDSCVLLNSCVDVS